MASFWAVKKQISYFLIVVIVIFGAGYFVWRNATKPTCFDNKQNQNEEGIDCGGPCTKECLGEIKDLVVLWSKFFEAASAKYDVAALVKNPNIFLGISSLKYQFKIYGKDNVLIATKDGETFITPGETYLIFMPGIDLSSRTPGRVFIEFESNPGWQKIEKEKPALVVVKKQFFNEAPFPRLTATIENKSVSLVNNIDAAVVLYDKDENARAVSTTKIDSISGGSSQEIVFTWFKPFSEEPSSSAIFFRTGF